MRTEDVDLSSRFNIICGQNNAGKSAFIETLSDQGWRDHPHRSMSIPTDQLESKSSAVVRVAVCGADLIAEMTRAGQQLCIPVFPSARNHQECYEIFSKSSEIIISARRFTSGWQIISLSIGSYIATSESYQIILDSEDRAVLQSRLSGFGSIAVCFQILFKRSCYYFKAERLAIGARPQNAETILSPKAENLADVLHSFQNTARARYESFLTDVRLVLPNINVIVTDTFMAPTILPGQLQATNYPHVKIKVWLAGSSEDRRDLGFDLEDCGTGVGQIVSMLLVIHSATSSKVIVIDEPNSFLHPGTTRRLYQIFKRFHQHQFVVSTHSAELLGCAESPAVHLVKWVSGSANLESLSRENTDHIRSVLEELGVQLSDVFGADKIIWVEGPTECKVFADVLRHKGVEFEAGLRFLPVVSTSDLAKNTKKAKTIVDIYETISRANAIIPPAVLIGLDRETFSDEQVKALTDRLGDRVRFLDRRCIENYVLSAQAIATVLSRLDAKPIDEVQKLVDGWFAENARDVRYKGPQIWSGDLSDRDWLIKVDGARLLADIFNDVTDTRHPFDKISHTPLLVMQRLRAEEEQMQGLIEYVMGLYEPALSRPSSTPQ